MKRPLQWSLWFIPLMLSACGLVMIASLSLRNNITGTNPYGPPFKQAQFLFLGMLLMVCCALTPPEFFRKHSGKLWTFSLILLFLTAIPGIGVKVGGARRWLNILGVRFQPLELLLIAVPLVMANRLEKSQRHGIMAFLNPAVVIIVLSASLLMMQPNLGGTILVTGICFLMHAEYKGWKFPLMGGVFGVILIIIAILIAPYRFRRFEAFRDPWSDPMNKGFQIIQGLVAFANGNITGVGIGKGLQKDAYLPEADTDYIFPAIGEEFGLVGTMTLLLLYAVWTHRVYVLYKRLKILNNNYLALLTLGLAASIICPMFVNIAGVTKLMPLTGIPLPFISAGGSSMLCMWIKVGMLVAINTIAFESDNNNGNENKNEKNKK